MIWWASDDATAALEDEQPSSEDKVITTLLIRVSRMSRTVPDNIRVERNK